MTVGKTERAPEMSACFTDGKSPLGNMRAFAVWPLSTLSVQLLKLPDVLSSRFEHHLRPPILARIEVLIGLRPFGELQTMEMICDGVARP